MNRYLLLSLIFVPVLACGPLPEEPAPPIDPPAEEVDLDCGLDAEHNNDLFDSAVLQFETPEACVRIVRRDIADPDFIYKEYPWALDEMYVGTSLGNETLGDLEWLSSHHNWNDSALGATEGRQYTLALDLDIDGGDFNVVLTAEDDDGVHTFDFGKVPTR